MNPRLLILIMALLPIIMIMNVMAVSASTIYVDSLNETVVATSPDALYKGVQIIPLTDIIVTNVTTYPGDTSPTCKIQNSTFSDLATSSVIDNNASFTYALSMGETYTIICGGAGNVGYSNQVFRVQNGTYINFTNEVYDGSINNGAYRSVWKITYTVDSSVYMLTACNNTGLDKANTTYRLANSITTSESCFNISANNIILDLNGHEIVGNSSMSTSSAIYSCNPFNSITCGGVKYENLTIKNGKIRNFNEGSKYVPCAVGPVKSVFLNNQIGGRTNVINMIFENNTLGVDGGINTYNNITLFKNSLGIYVDGGTILYNINSTDNTCGLSIGGNGVNIYNMVSALDDDNTIALNAAYLYNLIYNNTFGRIAFKLNNVNVNGTLNYGTGTNIDITSRSAYFNPSSDISELNVASDVILYGMPKVTFNPKLLKDNNLCSSGCSLAAYRDSTIFFNVSSWSNYTVLLDTTDNSNHNLTTFETSKENYNINVTFSDLDYPSPSMYLWINNIPTSIGVNSTVGDLHKYSYARNIPLVSSPTNISILWELRLNSTYSVNTTNSSQLIKPLFLTECNATFITQYLNISFYDESTLSSVDAFIPNMNIQFSLGGSIFKSYDFSQLVARKSYAFCANNNNSLTTSMSMQYGAATYGTRNIVFTGSLVNSTVFMSYPLLSTSSGTTTKIQVVDSTANIAIQNALVVVSRLINNSYATISSDTTGSDGTVVFLLNAAYKHRLNVSATGYQNTTIEFNPSTDTYIVHLTPLSIISPNSNITNISYSFWPKSGVLQQNSVYNFTFNITKLGISNIGSIKIVIGNTTTTINSSILNVTGSSASVGLLMNTSNQSKIITKYYALVNGSTDQWILLTTGTYQIYNTYEGDNSILHAIKSMRDLKNDNEEQFTAIFICLLLIMIGYAGFTRYTGIEIQNPGITMIIFACVITALSVGNFLTLNFIQNSFINQYAFALLTWLVTIGFMLSRWRDA